MKDLARHLVRSGMPLRRPQREPVQENPPPDPVKQVRDRLPKEPETLPPHSVYRIPDAWDTRERIEHYESKTPPPANGKIAPSEVPELQSKKASRSQKRRDKNISLCVSQEEERLLRQYAASKDMNFSEWARSTLFRAMGRKVPARYKDED
jgi:hypothetical protein